MHSIIDIEAPAKINLFLNLLNPRPDGFHEVRFVMQTVDLKDLLSIEVLGSGHYLDLTCDLEDLVSLDNLIVKAYEAFYNQSGIAPLRLKVHLTKRIPLQAGLGGGSSNAAAMLKALNQLHGEPLQPQELEILAADLGSDVAFFLSGHTAVATGRGEHIDIQPALPPFEVLLLKPKHWGISTPEAFGWIRENNRYKTKDFSRWDAFFQGQRFEIAALASLLHNDFEPVVFAHHPQLKEAKLRLMALGLPGVLLSGSGPTLFGLLDEPDRQWTEIQAEFPESSWWLCKSRFC